MLASIYVRAKQGDIQARNEVILKSMGLMQQVLRRYGSSLRRLCVLDDALSEATLAVIAALSSFDETKGPFEPYCYRWVNTRVYRFYVSEMAKHYPGFSLRNRGATAYTQEIPQDDEAMALIDPEESVLQKVERQAELSSQLRTFWEVARGRVGGKERLMKYMSLRLYDEGTNVDIARELACSRQYVDKLDRTVFADVKSEIQATWA